MRGFLESAEQGSGLASHLLDCKQDSAGVAVSSYEMNAVACLAQHRMSQSLLLFSSLIFQF